MTIGEEIVENLDLPLDRIIQELDAGCEKLPEDAIREAQKHRDLIIPRLIQSIRDATAKAAAGDSVEGNAHFFALFLLAEFRAKEALPAIVEAISLPGELPFDLFGDAITQDLSSILAALGCDTQLLDRLIQDRALNEYVRWEAAGAYLPLVCEGLLTREVAVERLRGHLNEAIAHEDREIIGPLILTLLDYSPREAREEINEAFRRNLIEEFLVCEEDVEDSISEDDAEFQNSLEASRHREIVDTVESLKGWASFSEQEDSDDFDEDEYGEELIDEAWPRFADDPADVPPAEDTRGITIRNTNPRVGRNDPCPCGSGKKFKKCCGGR